MTDFQGVDVYKRPIHCQATSTWNTTEVREPMGPLLKGLGSVVYAVRTKDGLIKIGCTVDLSRRAWQVGYGMKSILAWRQGTLDDEAQVHASLDGLAVRGREWYPPHPRVLAVVNEMREALGISSLTA